MMSSGGLACGALRPGSLPQRNEPDESCEAPRAIGREARVVDASGALSFTIRMIEGGRDDLEE